MALPVDVTTAIDVHRAIKRSSRLPSIGYLPLESADSDDDSSVCSEGSDTDELDMRDVMRDINTCLDEAAVPLVVEHFNSPMSKYPITTPLGISTIAELDGRLEELYGLGTASPFGRGVDTVVDETVRRAREVTNFGVIPEMITELEAFWAKSFFPSQVKVIPYKINIYPADGKFDPHRDTPITGLVGTILVGLGIKGPRSPHLLVGGHEWSCVNGDICAFYSDVIHEVRVSNCYRGTIAFKVYATTQDVMPKSPNIQLQNLLSKLPHPCGFLLSHRYSCDATQLKGRDEVLVSNLGPDYMLVPVVVSIFKGDQYDDEPATVETTITPLTPEVITFLANTPRASDINNPGVIDKLYQFLPRQAIPFYSITEGFKWKHHKSEGEYTGNESLPAFASSVYLNMAVLIR